jgi:hypothetical protein
MRDKSIFQDMRESDYRQYEYYDGVWTVSTKRDNEWSFEWICVGKLVAPRKATLSRLEKMWNEEG